MVSDPTGPASSLDERWPEHVRAERPCEDRQEGGVCRPRRASGNPKLLTGVKYVSGVEPPSLWSSVRAARADEDSVCPPVAQQHSAD